MDPFEMICSYENVFCHSTNRKKENVDLLTYVGRMRTEKKEAVSPSESNFYLTIKEEVIPRLSTLVDIDSFFHQSHSLMVHNFELYLYIPHFAHEKCAEIGNLFGQKISTRSVFSYTLGCFGEGKVFRTYLVFPHIPYSEYSAKLVTHLYEKIIIPALKSTNFDFQRIPVSMAHSMEKYRTAHGSVNLKGFWITGKTLNIFLKAVSDICECHNNDWNFKDFFLQTEAKGLKFMTSSYTYQESLEKFNSVVTRSFSESPKDIAIDVAIEARPETSYLTLAFKRTFLDHLKNVFETPSSIEIDNFCQTYEYGGLRGHPRAAIADNYGIYFLQAYSIDKDIVVGKKELITNLLLSPSSKYTLKKLESLKRRLSILLSSSRHKSFGCRLEFRLNKLGVSYFCRHENLLKNIFIEKDIFAAFMTNSICIYRETRGNIFLDMLIGSIKKAKYENTSHESFDILLKIIFKTLFSKFQHSGYIKKLNTITRTNIDFHEIVKKHNCFVLDETFFDSRNYCLNAVESYGLSKKNEAIWSVSQQQVLEIMATPKTNDHMKWFEKDPIYLAYSLHVIMKNELIYLFPSAWFKSRPNNLTLSAFKQCSLKEFDLVSVRTWTVMYRKIFFPRKKTVRWAYCSFFALHKMALSKLDKKKKLEFESNLIDHFLGIEIIPYIDDKTGRFIGKSRKTGFGSKDVQNLYWNVSLQKSTAPEILPISRIQIEVPSKCLGSKEQKPKIDDIPNASPVRTKLDDSLFEMYKDFIEYNENDFHFQRQILKEEQILKAYKKYFPTLDLILRNDATQLYFKTIPLYYMKTIELYVTLDDVEKCRLFYNLLSKFRALKYIPKISKFGKLEHF